MDDKVIKRDIVGNVMSYINDSNIIVLHGARQVGKTHIL
jgi:predicted AAA+ superfamily ATPase